MKIEVGDRVTINGKSQYLVDGTVGFCEGTITKVERIGKNGWYTIYEKKENKELLTDEEREFLKSIIKYYKGVKVDFFTSGLNLYRKNGCFLNCLAYPQNMKFKGVEQNKKYTLSELRIGGINGRN